MTRPAGNSLKTYPMSVILQLSCSEPSSGFDDMKNLMDEVAIVSPVCSPTDLKMTQIHVCCNS